METLKVLLTSYGFEQDQLVRGFWMLTEETSASHCAYDVKSHGGQRHDARTVGTPDVSVSQVLDLKILSKMMFSIFTIFYILLK